MKKFDDYRTLLEVSKNANLDELKKAYRNIMKQWHPDKFQEDEEGKLAAEEKSKKLIEAYHFLVSIAPETHQQNEEEYNNTINNSAIVNYNYKGITLQINFADGNSFEYFEVPKATYIKFHNADAQSRFARRHICTSFVFRNISKMVTV